MCEKEKEFTGVKGKALSTSPTVSNCRNTRALDWIGCSQLSGACHDLVGPVENLVGARKGQLHVRFREGPELCRVVPSNVRLLGVTPTQAHVLNGPRSPPATIHRPYIAKVNSSNLSVYSIFKIQMQVRVPYELGLWLGWEHYPLFFLISPAELVTLTVAAHQLPFFISCIPFFISSFATWQRLLLHLSLYLI